MPITCVLTKAYIQAHTRRLPSGRTITVQPYFTKRVGKGEAPKRKRTPKGEAVPKGVYGPLHPEHLSARLVRHVEEGTMSHAEAHANLDHLERRAHAGHHLEHGHGPSWTPEETHVFIKHARGKLYEHQQAKERAVADEERKQAEEKAEHERQDAERHRQAGHRPAQGITTEERQRAWDERMQQRQQAERERGQGEKPEQEKPQTEAQERRIALAVKNLQSVLRSRSVTPAMIESRIQGLERMAKTGKRLWGGYTKDDMGEIAQRLRHAFPQQPEQARPSQTQWQQQEQALRGQARGRFEQENQRRGRPIAKKSLGVLVLRRAS